MRIDISEMEFALFYCLHLHITSNGYCYNKYVFVICMFARRMPIHARAPIADVIQLESRAPQALMTTTTSKYQPRNDSPLSILGGRTKSKCRRLSVANVGPFI